MSTHLRLVPSHNEGEDNRVRTSELSCEELADKLRADMSALKDEFDEADRNDAWLFDRNMASDYGTVTEAEATDSRSTQNNNAELHKITVQDLLDMPKEDREQILNWDSTFSPSQMRELWRCREKSHDGQFHELDNNLFHIMINSALAMQARQDAEATMTCPFTGLQANTEVSGWYGSTWMDSRELYIHSSAARDLVNLAHNVGAGVGTLDIIGENGVLFEHSSGFPLGNLPKRSFEDHIANGIDLSSIDYSTLHVNIENNIGALDEMDIDRHYDLRSDIAYRMDDLLVKVSIKTPEDERSVIFLPELREEARPLHGTS